MKRWYAVRTKTNQEDRALVHLNNQGFETYLPRYRKQIRHARKVQTVLRPLFPGYAFVHIDLQSQPWLKINGTVGVIGLVKFGAEPNPLPDEVIETFMRREDEKGAVRLGPESLKKGDRVRIREGAFSEYSALLEETSDDKRVTLLLDLMGRAVRVSVPIDVLTKET